jgi:outer membrane protein assembly factor BamB
MRLTSRQSMLCAVLLLAGLAGAGVASAGGSRALPARRELSRPSVEQTTPSGLAAELWISRYNGPGNGDDTAADAGVSPNGSTVFVTGTSDGHYETVAYDSDTGATLWAKPYVGNGFLSIPHSLGVSPDGSKVFVTGESYPGGGGSQDYATVAYDSATGATLWAQRYDGPIGGSTDIAHSLAVSPDSSKVFVTGESVGSGTGFDYATVAYDAATGAQLWVQRYDYQGNAEVALAVGVSPDGSKVFVTGEGHRGDYATLAYNAATGAQLWVQNYPSSFSGVARALAVSPDGTRVFVTGNAFDDYVTVAYGASSGAQMWASEYNGPRDAADEARAISVSPDGARLFVTGYLGSRRMGHPGDFGTIAYDSATGTQLWAQIYNGPGRADDQAADVGVNPAGTKVFVTGASVGSASSYDYATIAYDAATGARQWLKRYNGPANGSDQAAALAVGPGGHRVFVTGSSAGSGTGADYATIAYHSR